MKNLKRLLIGIYPVLILLLLLCNLKGCSGSGYGIPGGSAGGNDGAAAIGDERPGDGAISEPNDSTQIRQAEQNGQKGALKITLLWNFPGDIDLHVRQPNHKTIYFHEPRDRRTGGFLDVDNQNGGNGSAENIFFQKPKKGMYRVSLVYFQPSRSSGVKGSGTCSVIVFQEGKEPKTYNVEMSEVKEQKIVVEFNVD